MKNSNYVPLNDLEIYGLARQLSSMAWEIYSNLSFEQKKIMGNQFIRATDSVGANIAEGYSRFYHLDRCRFYFNSRASLSESMEHWASLMMERNIISNEKFKSLNGPAKKLQVKLNNFISKTYEQSKKNNK